MKMEEITNNDPEVLLNTIKNLGFTLVEISKRIYPRNHENYLSGRFSERRIKPKDMVLIVNFITSRIGKAVFDMEYHKELDRYNEMMERKLSST
ncbi:MAG: hypothetical protein ACE364_01090 [Chlorobiota bacterium]